VIFELVAMKKMCNCLISSSKFALRVQSSLGENTLNPDCK